MEVSVTAGEKWQRKLEITIPYTEIEPKFNEALENFRKRASLPGYRVGKVPLEVIKKQFGKSIEADVIGQVIPEFYRQAIQKENLQPIGEGQIRDIQYKKGEDIVVTAMVDIQPEFKIKNFKNLEVTKHIHRFREEDLQDACRYIQEKRGMMRTVENGIKEGDFLEVDIQELDAGNLPLVGHKETNVRFRLRKGEANETWIGPLLGSKAGEDRTVTTEYPANHSDKSRAGKKFKYSVKIHKAEEQILRELDDELAKEEGFENLEKMKESLRKGIEAQFQFTTQRQLNNDLANELVKQNDLEVPESMIRHYLDHIIEDAKKRGQKIKEETVYEHFRADAIWAVKWFLIQKQIAQEEKLEITDEEIDRHIDRVAQLNKMEEKQKRAILHSQDQRKRIREDLLEEKILNYVLTFAKVTEEIVKPETLAQPIP